MTSVDAALDVLAAERDRGDGQAALVAMGMLLTGDDRGVELAESLGNSTGPQLCSPVSRSAWKRPS